MPGKLVRKLETSAMGCYWMLGVLEQLLERRASDSGPAEDRLRMIRLLGRNPVETPG